MTAERGCQERLDGVSLSGIFSPDLAKALAKAEDLEWDLFGQAGRAMVLEFDRKMMQELERDGHSKN
jgi:hypothetical protein